MGLVERGDGWRIPDVLWSQIEPLIPSGKPHPLGCHNPRVRDRDAMTAILFVLRTGCQWNALNATGICSSSSAHRRFVEWTEAGVFEQAWVAALADYDEFVGVDWRWLSMDGAMTKAPLGEKNGAESTDRAKGGTKRSLLTEANGVPLAIVVAGANRDDFKLARETLESIVISRPKPTRDEPQGLCLDKGSTTMRCVSWPTPFASPRTSDVVAKRPEPPRRPAASRRVAGWSNARTAG